MNATVIAGPEAAKLPLGQIVITANASARLDPAAVSEGLRRHAAGDWGDICPERTETGTQLVVMGYRS